MHARQQEKEYQLYAHDLPQPLATDPEDEIALGLIYLLSGQPAQEFPGAMIKGLIAGGISI
jgi:hypothetical protein